MLTFAVVSACWPGVVSILWKCTFLTFLFFLQILIRSLFLAYFLWKVLISELFVEICQEQKCLFTLTNFCIFSRCIRLAGFFTKWYSCIEEAAPSTALKLWKHALTLETRNVSAASNYSLDFQRPKYSFLAQAMVGPDFTSFTEANWGSGLGYPKVLCFLRLAITLFFFLVKFYIQNVLFVYFDLKHITHSLHPTTRRLPSFPAHLRLFFSFEYFISSKINGNQLVMLIKSFSFFCLKSFWFA